jgi:hypothetical protein
MHWKKRQKQTQYLQAKHGNDLATEFPIPKVRAALIRDAIFVLSNEAPTTVLEFQLL